MSFAASSSMTGPGSGRKSGDAWSSVERVRQAPSRSASSSRSLVQSKTLSVGQQCARCDRAPSGAEPRDDDTAPRSPRARSSPTKTVCSTPNTRVEHFVRHDPLEQGQRGNVDDGVPTPTIASRISAIGGCGKIPISAIGMPQSSEAEREVGGQPLPTDESERRDRAEQAADPDRRVQEADSRLARGRAARATATTIRTLSAPATSVWTP